MDPKAEIHVFRSPVGAHLFLADGNRVYDVPEEVAGRFESWLRRGGEPEPATAELARALGLDPAVAEAPAPPAAEDASTAPPPPLAALSLSVAQSCNRACDHCSIEASRFGSRARLMSLDVARGAVDRLLVEAEPEADLLLGFLGGEPLLNRDVLFEVTRYAARAARRAGRELRFTLSTNGALLQRRDVEFFHEFPFTVLLRLDTERFLPDRERSPEEGGGHDPLRRVLELFERHGRPRHLVARIAVTAESGELLPLLDRALGLGFDEVGFAAVVVSPEARWAFRREDFDPFLERMIACGEKALEEILAGRPYPFGNFEAAMHQIHHGMRRTHPCGAGAAYLSAGAEGGLFACHRLLSESAFAMGDARRGSDPRARSRFLARHHVDFQEPCRGCWARYLCGGGCYHEVARRGRLGCDFIRGWLSFCLGAYAELLERRPGYFPAEVRPGRDRLHDLGSTMI